MRLFTKYSRVNILASVLALLLGSIGYFFAVRYVLQHQLDGDLRVEEEEILDHVAHQNRLPQPANYRDQQIAFALSAEPVKRQFRNTHEGRLLVFPVKIGDQYYTASVSKSAHEMEDLIGIIMYITAGMILLMLGVLFLANRLLLRRIWQPFYHTLDGIRAFNLQSRELPAATPTNIDEFRRLDAAARQMTEHINRDYEMLKSFTENASHEMQTPLAILNSKLDLLIQDPRLREEQHGPVQAMYDAISRLRQLNQSLLLLTKIGNNQFPQTGPVNLAPLIEEKLAQLEDPLKDRQLQVNRQLSEWHVAINSYLADILLNNLLINAIRHNKQAGFLSVELGDGALRIRNSGPAPSFDPATIFDRFVKGAHSGGTGLGLAIVRQICENYGFTLSYNYQAEMHAIEIGFPN
jgi:signal transduction histidine kinase